MAHFRTNRCHNGLDVAPFVEVLLSGPYQPEADMNEDQVVNGLDVDPFVAAVVGGTQQIPEPRPSSSASSLWAWSVRGGSGSGPPDSLVARTSYYR
jgi:hypothetical protein